MQYANALTEGGKPSGSLACSINGELVSTRQLQIESFFDIVSTSSRCLLQEEAIHVKSLQAG